MKLDGLWKHTNYARLSNLSAISNSTRFIAAIAVLALSFAVPVSAGELGDCAAEYTTGQGGLNCTAADDGGGVTATGVPSFCVISEFLTFDVTTTFLNSSQAERYDPRYWVAVDGGDVRLTAANGGPAICSTTALAIGAGGGTILELENIPADTCGDIDSGVLFPLTTIDTVSIQCIPDANGAVEFNTAITWDTSTGDDCAIGDLRTNADISKSQAACVETALDQTESLGRVTVIKSAPEDEDNTNFVFNWSTDSPPQLPDNQGLNPTDPFLLADGGVQGILYSLVTLDSTAVVTITEQDPTALGYILESIECPGASVSPIANGVEVTLTYDENNPDLADVTCTFNNELIPPNPDMSVSKSSTTGAITAPGTVTYDYVVRNLGNVDLHNVFLSDDNDNDDVVCPSTTVAVGEPMDCSATHTVTQAEIDANGSPTPGSGFLSNVVTASSDETGDETASLDIPITQDPELDIDKVGTFNGGAFAQVGDTISYTFEVSNIGNVTLTNVEVTDALVGTITCPSGDNPIQSLDPGASETCTGSYSVVQADIDAGQRDNIGIADSFETDPPVENPETVPLGQNPDMTVEKSSATTSISAPGIVSYRYVVTNTGNVSLTNILLIDDNIDAIDATVNCSGATTLAPGGNFNCIATHTVTQGELDANGSPDADSGNLVNNVDATSDEGPLAEATLSIPLVQTPSVAIVKDGTWNDDGSVPNIAEVGETISYTFDITNDGNVTLFDVLISDPLIATINCPSGNPIPSMAPGATEQCTGSYTLVQTDLDAGQRDNTATADSPQTEPDTDDEIVILPSTADILIVKTGSFDDNNDDTLAQPGETISYSFAVTNNDTTTLTDVTVTDPLVPVIDCPSGNPIPSLAAGVTETCTGSYAVTQGDIDTGQVDNTATANSVQAGPATDDETVTLPTSAGLEIIKAGTWNDDGSVPGSAEAGETISYSFLVTNTGNVTLTMVEVTDPLVGTIDCPSGANPILSLAPGASETCTGSYVITQADVDNGSRDNTGTADSVQTEPDTDDETVLLPQGLSLTVVKSSETASIAAPTTVLYRYLVTNNGDTTLTAISLVDDNISSDMICPPPPGNFLAPGAFFTCTATKVITQGDVDNFGSPVVDSGELLNNVIATSAEAPPDTASWSIPFVFDPSITVAKTSTTAQVTGTGPVDYNYLVINTGNVTLSGLSIDDDNDEDDASCPVSTLAPGENTICTATHIVTADEISDFGSPVADSGVLVNNATATASSPRNEGDVSDSDSYSIPFVEGAARFTVIKDFSDDNTATVDVTISCNTGLPLTQEFTISEGHQVTFIVDSYAAGEMDCVITEEVPEGYTPEYSNGEVDSAESCVFEEVAAGATLACIIYNELDPVIVTVNKEWIGVTEEGGISLLASAAYECRNVLEEPDSDELSTVSGSLSFEGELDVEVISNLYPDYGGSSYCTVSEMLLDSAAEGDDSDCAVLPIEIAQGNSCTIYNTVFFEGIPTLNRYGMLLLALLMLGVGVIGFRRFS